MAIGEFLPFNKEGSQPWEPVSGFSHEIMEQVIPVVPWADGLTYPATMSDGAPVHVALLRFHVPSFNPPYDYLLVFAFGERSTGTKFRTNAALLTEVLEAEVDRFIGGEW